MTFLLVGDNQDSVPDPATTVEDIPLQHRGVSRFDRTVYFLWSETVFAVLHVAREEISWYLKLQSLILFLFLFNC
jgi:hypothetical protein